MILRANPATSHNCGKGLALVALLASAMTIALVPPAHARAQTATKPPAKTAPTKAQSWTIDARQSRIGFATQWAGQPVTGQFNQWSGEIAFDPANLAASKAIILIQTGSAITGVKEPDDNLGGQDWFDVRRFPTARYETTRIRSVGGGNYVADGLLTIKGVAYRLALPFSLTINGKVATMKAQASVDRMVLKLGLESDAGAQWVARETKLTISVRATQKSLTP
jgi:cytochrome b561